MYLGRWADVLAKIYELFARRTMESGHRYAKHLLQSPGLNKRYVCSSSAVLILQQHYIDPIDLNLLCRFKVTTLITLIT